MADIKVMLADGHALVRAGVRRLLEEDEEIEVSEEARDGMECLDRMCAFAGGNEGFRILLQAQCSEEDIRRIIGG